MFPNVQYTFSDYYRYYYYSMFSGAIPQSSLPTVASPPPPPQNEVVLNNVRVLQSKNEQSRIRNSSVKEHIKVFS